MSQHVFAWVAGFGWTLMPFAPFRFERIADRPQSLAVEHAGPLGVGRVVVTLLDDGRRIRSEPANTSGPRTDVVELIEGAAYSHWEHGAAHDHWRIETTVFSVRWPEGFAIRSVADAPPPFELTGPDKALIWVQGPFMNMAPLPPLDRMAGPGQTTDRIDETSGGPLVELRYQHEGAPWRMFHSIVNRYPGAFCVVTGQSPASRRDLVRAAVEEIAASLTPCAE